MTLRPAAALLALALPLALPLAACHSGGRGGANLPGDDSDRQPFHDIPASETLHFTGTEPFWGGQVTGSRLSYTTPEKPDGQTLPIERFGGRGGLSFSGSLEGKSFDMMVTPGACSDGMSDRTYPYTVTLRIGESAGEEVRKGCAWSDVHPFTGPAAP